MRPFHPPLRLSIFYGSRDQRPPGSLLPKSKYTGNEVAVRPGFLGGPRGTHLIYAGNYYARGPHIIYAGNKGAAHYMQFT
jgi:hypothetical protein